MMKMLRRVLITGGARGIGKEIGRAFGAAGWEVVLTDIDAEALEEARAELAAEGMTAYGYRMDVTDPASIESARAALLEEVGRVTAIVNNAGIVYGGPFLDVPLEKHHLTYRINVEGTVNVTHAFMSQVLDSPKGHLVFLASASGFIGLPNGSTYASSKWAAIGFAESIRAELRQQGVKHVHVTTVCPSYVDTGLFEGAEAPATTRMLQPAELAAQILEAVEKEQVWLLTPATVKLTPMIRNLLPTPLADAIGSALGVDRSMEHWSGHDGEEA